jgi:uncharacterized protein YndB with AHSA1/START domain
METKKQQITIQTTVDAPIEKVWAYWSAPGHITQWNSASPDWHTPKATNDLRVGGKFSSTMAAKDGSVSFNFSGTYTGVTGNSHIAYTIDDGRKAILDFEETAGGVKITVTFEAENENPIEMQRGGWQAILDSFKKYTEENEA